VARIAVCYFFFGLLLGFGAAAFVAFGLAFFGISSPEWAEHFFRPAEG
jgi:hypothetical protein